jgi:hypothetical protein
MDFIVIGEAAKHLPLNLLRFSKLGFVVKFAYELGNLFVYISI